MTIYHLILESTLGLTSFRFVTEYLEREGLLPGFVDGYSKIHHDETRHIGYGVWFLRETVARVTSRRPKRFATTLARPACRRSPKRSAAPARRRRTDIERLGVEHRGNPRVRARRPDPPARDHRRTAGDPLSVSG